MKNIIAVFTFIFNYSLSLPEERVCGELREEFAVVLLTELILNSLFLLKNRPRCGFWVLIDLICRQYSVITMIYLKFKFIDLNLYLILCSS